MATTSSIPHINTKIGLVGFAPEVTKNTPNYDFKASGGTTTTSTVDTSTGTGAHDLNINGAADDFFNALLLIWKSNTTTSALRNKVYPITDFAEAGGVATFTTGAMAAAPSAGDEFYVIGILAAKDISVSPTIENHPRDFVRQNLTPPSSLKGLATASGSFGFELPGLETPSADGSAAGEDRYSQFLKCIGTRSAGVGEAVTGAGSTTTTVDVTDASLFSVGQKVMINGEVRRVTAIDTVSVPDNITVDRALSAAPSASDLVLAGEHFTPDDGGQQSHSMLFLTDDRLVEVRGCVFNIKAGGDYGGAVMGTAEFDGIIDTTNYGHQDAVSFNGNQSSKKAIVFKAGEVYFGSSRLNVSNFEADFAHGRQRLADTGQLAFDIRSAQPTVNANTRDIGRTPFTTWSAVGTQGSLLVAVGNESGNCVAFEGNAQVQDSASAQNVNDTQYWGLGFAVVDDQEDADAAFKLELVRF